MKLTVTGHLPLMGIVTTTDEKGHYFSLLEPIGIDGVRQKFQPDWVGKVIDAEIVIPAIHVAINAKFVP
jgi:hypothetical protein